MGKLVCLQVLLLLLLHPPPPFTWASNPQSPPAHHSTFISSKGLVTIFFITTALLLIAFFSLYIQHCRGRDRFGGIAATPPVIRRQIGAKRGLDPAVIDSFPTLIYSDVKGLKPINSPVECAVCLSEFSDRETLRLLPRCNHVFHMECIDMWLEFHTTCPVCRAHLDADPPVTVSGVAMANEAETAPDACGAVTVDVRGSWTEEERERFTLRLPAELKRCRTIAGEGSSGMHGRTTWDWKAKSDRWAFLARVMPFDGPKGGEGVKGEGGSGITRGGDGVGDSAGLV